MTKHNPFDQDEANRRAIWRAVPEAKFQAQVKQLMEVTRWRTYHTWLSLNSEPGFPDIVAVRNNRILFAELKRYGEELTPAQQYWKLALEHAGAEFYAWDISQWDAIVETVS